MNILSSFYAYAGRVRNLQHFMCLYLPTNSEDVGDSSGLGGPFSAVAPLSTEDEEQPALCEYLRYR